MSQSSTAIFGSRRDQAFPTLSEADIDHMRRFGDASAYAAGEHIIRAGDVAPGLIVVLSGKDEAARGVVTIKDLRRGEQFAVARAELVGALKVEIEQSRAMGSAP